jgi:hypothetical protein
MGTARTSRERPAVSTAFTRQLNKMHTIKECQLVILRIVCMEIERAQVNQRFRFR